MAVLVSDYEKFVSSSKFGCFTQSENWCVVKKCWKNERLIVYDNDGNIKGTMQILIKKIPILNTTFMYSPRGPVCNYNDKEILSKLLEGAKRLAQTHHAYMLKIDPMVDKDNSEAINNFISLGFRYDADAPEDNTVQCKRNYILDICGKNEDEVFSSFHSKWRYNIRLAMKKGVICGHYGEEKLDDFFRLMDETGKRDKFSIRSKEYFSDFLKAFGDNARLYMCYAPDGKAISGAIAVNYANRVSYVYGASGNHQRNLMPNYLMQWNMIKWAIESGCDIYDFMGIPHCDDESHPNYGVYRFKKGFNGSVVRYAGEFDFIFSPAKYKIISFMLHTIGYKKM